MKENQKLSITECSKKIGVCRQAIYLAVKKGRIKYQVINKKYNIEMKDLIDYMTTKYSRRKSIYNGEPLFSENEMSPKEVSINFNIDLNTVYFLLKTGIIKYYRKNSSYIINKKDVKNIDLKHYKNIA